MGAIIIISSAIAFIGIIFFLLCALINARQLKRAFDYDYEWIETEPPKAGLLGSTTIFGKWVKKETNNNGN